MEPEDEITQASHVVAPLSLGARRFARIAGVAAGVILVVVLNLAGPIQFKGKDTDGNERVLVDVSRIAVDWTYAEMPDGSVVDQRNWISVQAFLWIAFCLGVAEIWIRQREVRAESWLIKVGMLPEDERIMLTADRLAPIYMRARKVAPKAMLPTLLRLLVMEFRKSQSVERVNSLLDSSLELLLHRLDLRYAVLRYLVWIIPTLGFIGTVIGIADALSFAGSGALPPEELLFPTTAKLGVAFYTTLLALLQSGVLMLGLNLTQAAEEQVLNDAGQYCIEHLVVRLIEPGHGKPAR